MTLLTVPPVCRVGSEDRGRGRNSSPHALAVGGDAIAPVCDDGVAAGAAVDHVALAVARVDRVCAAAGGDRVAPVAGLDAIRAGPPTHPIVERRALEVPGTRQAR